MPKSNAKFNLAIWLLFLVIFIDALGWGIVYPISEPILITNITHIFSSSVSMTIRNFWYESMVGIYAICMFFTSPLLGSLSDRYGRKKILVLSLLGNSFGFTVSGIGIIANNLILIILGRIIAGATAGALPIAQAAMMDMSSDAEKPKRLSLVALANVTGFALGPVIGGFFLDKNLWGTNIHYDFAFWATGLIGFLGMLLLLVFFKETYPGNKSQKINISTGFYDLYEAFTSSKVKLLYLTFLIFFFAWVIFFAALPLLLIERFAWEASSIGYFISFTGMFFGIGVVVLVPRLLKYFSIYNIVLGALVAMIICNILFYFAHYSIILWPLIVLTCAVPFSYIGIVTIISNAAGVDEQGKIMGIIGSLFALCWGIGPILVGYLTHWGINWLYVLSGCLFFIAILMFLQTKKYITKKEV